MDLTELMRWERPQQEQRTWSGDEGVGKVAQESQAKRIEPEAECTCRNSALSPNLEEKEGKADVKSELRPQRLEDLTRSSKVDVTHDLSDRSDKAIK